MKKDLFLLSRIFTLSVIVYKLDQLKKKSTPDTTGSELHARNRYAVADKVMEELQEQS